MTTHTEQNNGLISQHGNIWLCSIRNTAEAPLNGVWSEEEGSYASCFYCWFLESFKSCLLLPVALPSLIDTLVQLLAWRSMLWLSMTMCVAAKVLDTEWFPQHAQHGLLVWSLALHLFCFSQEKPAFMVKGNTRTQTHTHTQCRSNFALQLYISRTGMGVLL